MTTKKGGRPYKDAGITENFNQAKVGVTKKDVARAKRIAAAEKKLPPKKPSPPKPSQNAPEPSGLTEAPSPVITGYDEDGWPVFAEPEQPPPADAIPTDAQQPPATEEEDDDDDASAQKMLADMRWAYKTLKGRKKLAELMAGDKEFMTLVKELMKAEVSILTNKMKGGGSQRQGFFVILKGLEEEKPLVQAMQENKVIDVKQIEKAINPTLGPADQLEDDEDKGAAPAAIVKKADTVDSVENW